MIRDTAQISELIEKRVDDNISIFATDIVNQIEKFIKENGKYRHRPDRMYQVSEWHNGKPIVYSPMCIDRYRVGLQYCISKMVKDKMIDNDTKFLLDKMNSML
jgi:hypothetical protein